MVQGDLHPVPRSPARRCGSFGSPAVAAHPHRRPCGKIRSDPSQFTKTSSVPFLADWPTIPAAFTIPLDRIVDLTPLLTKDGRLDWKVPAGQWTILRIGRTTTGRENHPAPDGGLGLESDKLSKEATKAAFNGLVGRLVTENSALTGPGAALVSTHIDSWEVGSQNWTPRMREDFASVYGAMIPLTYLPVLTGRVVQSPEVSERFLWDLRRRFRTCCGELWRGDAAAGKRARPATLDRGLLRSPRKRNRLRRPGR